MFKWLHQRIHERVLLLAGMAAYIACFQWLYVNYLFALWDYTGYLYHPPQFAYMVLAWALSLLPVLWMPLRLTRPSQLPYWVLYVTVLIPSMFVPLYAGMNPRMELVALVLTIWVGFAITGAGYLFPLLRLNPPRFPRRLFWTAFLVLAAALAIWVVAVFRGRLNFVGLSQIYAQRFDAAEIEQGSLVGYPIMVLTGAIAPILMGWGLYYGRKKFFFTGVLIQILIYAAEANKSAIASIVFILAFYWLLRGRRFSFGVKMVWATAVMFAALALIFILVDCDPGPLVAVPFWLILMRTFGNGGLMTAQYYDFFSHNPHTYFSHVKGINWFVHYPYPDAIGWNIGYAYTGNLTFDANAHFWAGDGLAGMGLPGVLIISLVCALVFWLLDSVAQKHDVKLAALLLSFVALNLANISLFTTLLSGGLALMMLFLYFAPANNLPETARIRAYSGWRLFSRTASASISSFHRQV